MADAVKVRAEARDPAKNKGTGTKFSRKLRSQGRIPAIIYGHKQAPTPISLSRDAVWEMIKKRTHLAELEIEGAPSETVLVRDIQWDHLGKEILHLDFARVSVGEAIETEVRVDLKGVAPGVAEGGVLEHLIHALHVICRADAIPDEIKVDVSELRIGQAIHIKELKLPEGVTPKGDPDQMVVHVTTPAAQVAATEPMEGVQPEVIKPERKEKED
jgi:large subunit ribosomal protein L25